MRVPNPDSLPPLPARQVHSYGRCPGCQQQKLFASLVPDSSPKVLSKYTEMVDDIIQSQAEKLQQESDITRVKLQEMDLPCSLSALEGSAGLPDDLKDDVEAVPDWAGHRDDAAEGSQAGQRGAPGADRGAAGKRGQQGSDMQIRSKSGARRTRPQSSTLTENFHYRLNGYVTILKQAGVSDARIERSIWDVYSVMAILNSGPIEASSIAHNGRAHHVFQWRRGLRSLCCTPETGATRDVWVSACRNRGYAERYEWIDSEFTLCVTRMTCFLSRCQPLDLTKTFSILRRSGM